MMKLAKSLKVRIPDIILPTPELSEQCEGVVPSLIDACGFLKTAEHS